MKLVNLFKSSIESLVFWVAAWIGFVTVYSLSVKYAFHIKEWDYLIYIVQLIADVMIGLCGYYAYQSRKEKQSRYFYFLIFLSVIPGLFANESYNLLINIFGIKHITSQISLFWVVGYSAFLLIQIYA